MSHATRPFAAVRRLFALLHARNLEFVRDRRTLTWNLLMPFGIVFAFAFIFSGPEKPLFKVGVLPPAGTTLAAARAQHLHPLLGTRYIEFDVPDDAPAAVGKLSRHQLDLLLDLRTAGAPAHYWVNPDSPKGYITEKLLRVTDAAAIRNTATGKAVSYALEIQEVRERVLPALDTEFLKGHQVETVDALKERVRSDLRMRK